MRVASTIKLEYEGISVPKIIEYSGHNVDSQEYLVVENLNGENVNLSTKFPNERDKIHQSAGKILRKIHDIKTEGFGRLNSEMMGGFNKWADFIDFFFGDSFSRLRESQLYLDRYGDIIQAEYEKARKNLNFNQSGKFLHADFHLGNLFFKDNQVAGVLDLDIVSSGDPNWDTGHYCRTFNVDRTRGVKAFREGYGSNYNPESERFYNLIIWTRKIGSQAKSRPEALGETVQEFERILRGEI